ncbi:NlpC/P60 family protein [Blastococcus saxobsidens]|uniref:Cell wall-associated NlpC family hydrolase n=1 Tax=Blastococcus saxobsidens TaxID=138336 RepID=A0A4Q7YAH9_9ACTN|nr:NlpC/P60 family protein [Blastococcus saxobsidens]RZU33574.1 cell wall-associated NlpC family hydrolase [Blastococcus saxobsidens]
MATPLRTSGRRATLRRAGVALVGALGILLSTSPAAAEPGAPTTLADAARQVADRGHQLEVLTEEFNAARDTLDAQRATAAAAAAELEKATAALAAAQQSVRSVARAAYTGETLGSFQAMMISDSADEFVGRVATLRTIAGHHSGILARAAEANVAAAQAQAAAQQSATGAQAAYDAVAGQHAQLTQQIADYKAQFARLSAQDQRAVVTGSHSEGEAGADRAPETMASRTEREAPSAPVVADSRAAQIAVDAALAQRGKPYLWGGDGPGSFDCSGLTRFAFHAAGITLPRASRMQAQVGQSVSRDQLRPGDLVFFYRPISHVGIYIGDGKMVHAPTSGDVVKISNVDSLGGFSGARRVAG